MSIQFGGFAKVDYIQDFDPVGNDSQFKVNSIPVEGDPDAERGGSTNLSAKQTRFTVDVRGDTAAGVVRAYVEGIPYALGLRFGWVLLLVETAFFVPWIAWVVSDGSGRTEVVGSYLAAYGFLAAMVGGCAVVLVWLRRRVERQLTEVRELRAQLQAERRVA